MCVAVRGKVSQRVACVACVVFVAGPVCVHVIRVVQRVALCCNVFAVRVLQSHTCIHVTI